MDKKKFNLKDYPDWWECQWRRNSCNRPKCKLCGRIMKQRFKHKFKGEDPDSMESVLQDVGDTFAEVKLMIQQTAKERGINLNDFESSDIEEPPEHETYPLFDKTYKWILKMHKCAKVKGEGWVDTEAGIDLMWYANLIPPKTGRNLDNRWYSERGEPDHQYDYDYQKYVLENCVRIVKKSFEDIISMHLPQKNELIPLYNEFLGFEKEVLNI